MQIDFTQIRPYVFEATNDRQQSIQIIANPSFSGDAEGFRPMELLPSAFVSCASIDFLSILQKQRQIVQKYHVKVTADRVDEIPAVFSKIHADFYLTGDINPAKAEKALQISIDKYCSVSAHLSPTIQITHALHIQNA